VKKNIPNTAKEWQDAVDAAYVLISIDAARQYGLITGGPKANVDRCIEIPALGKRKGFSPSVDAVERVMGNL
jgi:hypothetical protein